MASEDWSGAYLAAVTKEIDRFMPTAEVTFIFSEEDDPEWPSDVLLVEWLGVAVHYVFPAKAKKEYSPKSLALSIRRLAFLEFPDAVS